MFLGVVFFVLGGVRYARSDEKQDLLVEPVTSTNEVINQSTEEPKTAIEVSLETPEAKSAEEASEILKQLGDSFYIPETPEETLQKEMWADADEVVQKLVRNSDEIVKKENVQFGSKKFNELVDRDIFTVRTEKAIANLTLIGGVLCVRVTHISSQDAILIGPREVLNPLLPSNSRFQKYVSKIFTFSGNNTGLKVRGRNIHLVRIGNAEHADAFDYLKKPKEWISRGWYQHYSNVIFNKPERKHVNSALFSTLCEMGLMYGFMTIKQHIDPGFDVNPIAYAWGAAYSLSWGLQATGLRIMLLYGTKKAQFLKAMSNTMAYTGPLAIMTGAGNILSVVGFSFFANKAADVQWSQMIKYDEKMRTMPGDLPTQLKFKVPYLKLWEKGQSSESDVKKLRWTFKFAEYEQAVRIPELGSRVTFKSILMRMPRFILKLGAIVAPGFGIPSLLISIPIMSVITYNYALKQVELGRVHADEANKFIKTHLENFWVRLWMTTNTAIGLSVNNLDVGAFLRGVMSDEYVRASNDVTKAYQASLDFIRSNAEKLNNLKDRAFTFFVDEARYTAEQIKWMFSLGHAGLSMTKEWARGPIAGAFTAFKFEVSDIAATAATKTRPLAAHIRKSTCRSMLSMDAAF